jgi:hypothetical protein
MRELTSSELLAVSGGDDGLLRLDPATGLNAHLVFGPVDSGGAALLGLLGIPSTSDPGELRIHLGTPVTPAP